jgi:hypothetical protein
MRHLDPNPATGTVLMDGAAVVGAKRAPDRVVVSAADTDLSARDAEHALAASDAHAATLAASDTAQGTVADAERVRPRTSQKGPAVVALMAALLLGMVGVIGYALSGSREAAGDGADTSTPPAAESVAPIQLSAVAPLPEPKTAQAPASAASVPASSSVEAAPPTSPRPAPTPRPDPQPAGPTMTNMPLGK